MRNKLCIIAVSLLLSSCAVKTIPENEIVTAPPESSVETTKSVETAEKSEESKTEETVVETEEPEDEDIDERRVIDGKIRSYLDGTMKDVSIANRRPIAAIMSNDKESLPNFGINRASIVYECPVEGSMNRYLAIIEEYDELERIGSVRSTRNYYIDIANQWNAMLLHFGQSVFAKPYLKDIDNINGLESISSTAFYRTKDRKAPHNAYSSGDRIAKSIDILGYSRDYNDSYQGFFKFEKPEVDKELENSLVAYKVSPGYAYNKPYFLYDDDSRLYKRYQYGKEHLGDEGQIEVKNILIQYAPVVKYSKTAYLNINVLDDSYGYYITNATCIPFVMKKNPETGVYEYFNTENEQIRFNSGKTWVCIVDSKNFDATVIEDRDGNRTNK